MRHEIYRELVASYVLDAVSASERRDIEAHLDVCPECTGEVASLRATVGELAYTAPRLRAPEGLKARVLSGLDDHVPAAGPVPVTRAAARRSTQPFWLATAAVFGAVLVGGYAMTLRAHIGFLDQELREARAQTQVAQRQLADVQTQMTRASVELQRVSLTTTILAAPDVVRVDMKSEPKVAGAVARAFWSRSRGTLFTSHSLPTLPSSQVYQLWIVTKSGPLSAGLLSPDAQGRALVVADPATTDAPTAFAVTVEPAGGVAAPTTTPVLVGAL
jgi:anti-sigma-K factor RskA